MKKWNIKPGDVKYNIGIPDTVVYVDSESGNDITGEGTMENPYKTLNRGRSESTNLVCRGYFDENYPSFSPRSNVFSDTLYGAVYAGNMQMNSGQGDWTYFLGFIFYYTPLYYGNVRSYSTDFGWFFGEQGKCFAILPENGSPGRRVGSFYKQDFYMSSNPGFYAERACAEDCKVYISTLAASSNMNYSVFKNCTFYLGDATEPLELQGTDEEQTAQLVAALTEIRALDFSQVKITSGPLFNDPENGDLTLHPDSVAVENKIYTNSVDFYYPCAFPPALNVKILPDSQGEKNAFDENSIVGPLLITEEGCIEPIRDGDGFPKGDGQIDSKVITLDRRFTISGVHVVLENDEINNGVHLGNELDIVKVRIKNGIERQVYEWELEDGAVYLNMSAGTQIKNEETGKIRELLVNESFVKRSHESVITHEYGPFGLLFSATEEGWIDCPVEEELLVKKVGDVESGRPDRDEEGNILSNGNPAFYSEENSLRPDFSVTAKYVQYRVIIKV
ncbi:MAG: hypothetical protein LUG18_15295 [Candidatus Azobacteroides sp.]|nr:hypothetical protein [Candidatus Azobacteroides sp.]